MTKVFQFVFVLDNCSHHATVIVIGLLDYVSGTCYWIMFLNNRYNFNIVLLLSATKVVLPGPWRFGDVMKVRFNLGNRKIFTQLPPEGSFRRLSDTGGESDCPLNSS